MTIENGNETKSSDAATAINTVAATVTHNTITILENSRVNQPHNRRANRTHTKLLPAKSKYRHRHSPRVL